MITIETYVKNPCGTLPVAFWKQQHFPVPNGMTIKHNADCSCDDLVGKKVNRYFRLLHTLDDEFDTTLPCGFNFRNVDTQCEIELVAEIIRRCYVDCGITKDEVALWTKFPVFDPSLWWFICMGENPIALGIADYDAEIGEGALEWVQVLPEMRHRGFGRAVVNKLLAELNTKAEFVTVSGETDNPANPESLYRKCGFKGNDVWCVIR